MLPSVAAQLDHLDNLDVGDDRRHGDPCEEADLAQKLVDEQQRAEVDEKYQKPEDFVVHADCPIHFLFPLSMCLLSIEYSLPMTCFQ